MGVAPTGNGLARKLTPASPCRVRPSHLCDKAARTFRNLALGRTSQPVRRVNFGGGQVDIRSWHHCVESASEAWAENRKRQNPGLPGERRPP